MKFSVRRVDWEYTSIFKIAYRTITHSQTVLVHLQDGPLVGRGEALPVSYRGETFESICDQLAHIEHGLSIGISRAELQSVLPPGSARNAVDCALWDLEAKRSGRRAWELAGLQSARPLETTYTLGLDTTEATATAAARALPYPC